MCREYEEPRAQRLGAQLALVYHHGRPDSLSADVTRPRVERTLHVFESPLRVRPTLIFFHPEDRSIKFHPNVIAQTERSPAAPVFGHQHAASSRIRVRYAQRPRPDLFVRNDGSRVSAVGLSNELIGALAVARSLPFSVPNRWHARVRTITSGQARRGVTRPLRAPIAAIAGGASWNRTSDLSIISAAL